MKIEKYGKHTTYKNTHNEEMTQKNINVRKLQNILFIDTETLASLIDGVMYTIPFDISYTIYNVSNDKVIKQKSLLVRKYFNNKVAMGMSFSAKKYQYYLDKIGIDKDYKIASVKEISQTIENLINKYDIKYMVAHNGGFDYNALNDLFVKDNIKNPFENLEIIDTMAMSRHSITTTKDYEKFCLANIDKEKRNSMTKELEKEFFTKSGCVRENAESISRYIFQDVDFIENHTGLEDIKIELAIFKRCLESKAIFPINCKYTWQSLKVLI